VSRTIVGILLSLAISVTAAGLWYLKTNPHFAPVESSTPPVLGVNTEDRNPQTTTKQPTADKIYGLINGYRRENFLSPLSAHAALEQSARLKLDDMIKKKYWRHGDANNYPPWQFFSQAGYQYAQAGENLAFGATSAWQTFTNWQNSQTHNQQLLEAAYEDMGIAIECDYYQAYAGETCLVVLHLAKAR